MPPLVGKQAPVGKSLADALDPEITGSITRVEISHLRFLPLCKVLTSGNAALIWSPLAGMPPLVGMDTSGSVTTGRYAMTGND